MPKLQALVADPQMETPTITKVEEGPCQEMAISPIGQGHNRHSQAVTLHPKVVACQDLEDCLEKVDLWEEVDPQEVVVDHLDMEDPQWALLEDPWVSHPAYCKSPLQHHREYILM